MYPKNAELLAQSRCTCRPGRPGDTSRRADYYGLSVYVGRRVRTTRPSHKSRSPLNCGRTGAQAYLRRPHGSVPRNPSPARRLLCFPEPCAEPVRGRLANRRRRGVPVVAHPVSAWLSNLFNDARVRAFVAVGPARLEPHHRNTCFGLAPKVPGAVDRARLHSHRVIGLARREHPQRARRVFHRPGAVRRHPRAGQPVVVDGLLTLLLWVISGLS